MKTSDRLELLDRRFIFDTFDVFFAANFFQRSMSENLFVAVCPGLRRIVLAGRLGEKAEEAWSGMQTTREFARLEECFARLPRQMLFCFADCSALFRQALSTPARPATP
jgi:hypothetical protein